jgi:hypothetical protein
LADLYNELPEEGMASNEESSALNLHSFSFASHSNYEEVGHEENFIEV